MRQRVLVCLFALATAWPAVARAQDNAAAESQAEARAQYQQGTQAFQAKKYAEAALHFESAASFRPHAVALYTAGLAWDLAGKPERAADAYARALDVPGLDAKQSTTAKERVAELEKTLGTVAVTGVAGAKVQLDALSEAPVPARLHAPPGPHTLSVRELGKPIERRDVTLEAGKTIDVDASKPPPAQAASPPASSGAEGAHAAATSPTVAPAPSNENFWITRRVIGVGVAGVGVAILGAAAVLGINANGAKDAYNAAPTREAFDHASSLETWTNVSLIAGAVALVGGIVLVVLPDSDRSEGRMRLGIGPRGATLGGTF